MKILLSYIHYPVCSGRYVKDALLRLGHDVKSVGYSTRDQIWGLRVDAKYSHFADGALDEVFPDWTPGLVIVMESAWAYHHPVYGAVPHVVYGVDNHVRDYRQDGIAHYFLAHDASSIMDMKADDVTWLPCGYDPSFTPSPIPFDERQYDVTLIGVMYEARVKVIDAMIKAGLKVQMGTGLLYEEYAQAYHNSRIALNVSAKGDLNQRIFETSALGCVVLSDAVEDLEAIDFKGVSVFKSLKGAISQAKKIASQPQPVIYNTVPHTWDERAKVIVHWYQSTYEKKGKSVEAN